MRWYQKGKTNHDFTEARDSGSGISWAICKSAPHSRQITTPAPHHSFLNRCKRLGFCDNTVPTISDIFSNADDSLFKTILKNSYHVLYPYIPENQYQHYHLRQRLHNKTLIPKTTYLSDRDYIMRMLYKKLTVISLLQYCHHPLCLCCLLF